MNARDAWLATLGQLRVQLNRSTYDTWLRHAELLGYEDGRFVIMVPNAYARDWIERHLLQAMTQTLCRIFQRTSEIQVIVWNPVEPEDDQGGPLLDYPASAAAESPAAPEIETPTGLHPAHRFETFVVGESNRYAALLAQAIVGSQVGKYSPVLFHGGMGMGKTHLLQAIAHGLLAQGHAVVYRTAEEFHTELVAAIRGQSNAAFREKYRLADVVLLDDLQFVEGKESTQNEIVAIWDALRNRSKAMIFASNRLPCDMVKVSKDARSRFQAGPIAGIEALDRQLSQDVLDAKALQRGVDLPAEVRDLIAAQITTSVRDLESAVEQLRTYSQLTGQAVTLPAARQVLKILGSAPQRPGVTLVSVLEATAHHYGLTVQDLAGRKRTKEVALARQVAMYLAREEVGASLPQIGEALGGRDHSTVVYGCARIAELVQSDLAAAGDIAAIREQLGQSANQKVLVPRAISPR